MSAYFISVHRSRGRPRPLRSGEFQHKSCLCFDVYQANHPKRHVFQKKVAKTFCQFTEKLYLCTRFSEKHTDKHSKKRVL